MNTFSGQDQRPIKANLSYSFNFNSSGAGILSNIIRIAGLTSTSDWLSYADLYQEFRVLGIELHYIPNFNGSYDASVIQGSGAVDTVHVPLVTAPTSLDEVVQHATWRPFRTSTPFKQVWKMYGVEESTFADTATVSSVNHGGVSFFANSLTPGIDYGHGVVTYLVEFRARK